MKTFFSLLNSMRKRIGKCSVISLIHMSCYFSLFCVNDAGNEPENSLSALQVLAYSSVWFENCFTKCQFYSFSRSRDCRSDGTAILLVQLIMLIVK